MDPSILPYVVLISGVVLSRFVAESGLKSLSPTQKAAVIDSFSSLRKYGLLVFLVAFVASYRYPVVLLSLVVAYVVINFGITFSKLRGLDVPESYRRKTWGASAISGLSVGLFLYLLSRVGA